jgi:hypothetical protein
LLLAAKAKGRKGKSSKSAAVVTSEEDDESEVEGLIEQSQMTAPPPRPKPRPAYRPAAPSDDHNPASATDDEDRDEVGGPAPSGSPKGRPRPKTTYKSNESPVEKSQLEVNGTSILDTPRKREREGDEEQSATDGGLSPAHGTQSSDIQIRRKRVRH